MNRALVLLLAVLSLVTTLWAAGPTLRIGPDKKLIEWGWDEPSPTFMRQNAARMDKLGFDGVIFHAEPVVNGKPVNFAWACWGAQAFQYEQFAADVASLQACRFKRLTDNFLRFNVCPGEVDWTDDAAFAVVVNNARVAAKFARETGCKGFMFDVEMYGKPLFDYRQALHRDTLSFADYEQVLRRRGEEFMRAVNAEYPDITMLLTFAYSITGYAGDRAKAPYGLLKPFLDGMFAAAAEKTVIVDAWEGAYPYRWHKQFASAYQTVREKLATVTGAPAAYRKHVQVGFGVWLDMDWRRYGWHTDDFTKNYFTPEEFAYSLFCALNTADRYVWVYTEKPRWWTYVEVPVAYRAALRRARGPLALDDARYPARTVAGVTADRGPRAASQPGYDDEATFGDLKATYDFIADLPKVWKFRTDPKHEGTKRGFFAPQADTSGWRELEIGKFWDEQSLQYVGYAWYRLNWTPPDFTLPAGRRLVLWFGAVDEQAVVWVNGAEVGKHEEEPDYGWDKRFPVDVTGKLLPGQPNNIVVRVHNGALAGGIWKAVKLAVSK